MSRFEQLTKEMDAMLKFEEDELVEAMEMLMSCSPSSKMHFNCAQIAMILNDAQEAILRDNTFIDYRTLGFDFVLYVWDVLFNIGLCLIVENDAIAGFNSFRKADDLAVQNGLCCTYISNAIELGPKAPNEIFPIEAPELLWHPRKSDIENLVKLEFLGKSQLVMSDTDSFIGFSGRKVKENVFGKDYRQRSIVERRREISKAVTFTYTPPAPDATGLRSRPSLKRSNTQGVKATVKMAELNRSNSAPSHHLSSTSNNANHRRSKLCQFEAPVRKESKGYRSNQKLACELEDQKDLIKLDIVMTGKPKVSLVTEKTIHFYYILDTIKSKLEINDSKVFLKYHDHSIAVLVMNNQDFANAIGKGISSFCVIPQRLL